MFKYIKYEKVETEYTTLEFRGDADGVKVNHFSDNDVQKVSVISIESEDEDDAPFLKVLADAEGSSLDDFAQAVLDKKTDFVAFSAQVFAKKRAFEKELMRKIGL